MAQVTDPAVLAEMKVRGEGYDPTRCKWHEETINELKEDFKKVDEAINGNGKEGMKSNIASMKSTIKVLLTISSLTFIGMIGMLFHVLTTAPK